VTFLVIRQRGSLALENYWGFAQFIENYCSQAWKLAANFADNPGKFKIFPSKPALPCMGRVGYPQAQEQSRCFIKLHLWFNCV